ncbi:Transposase family Tnp2 protein [Rhizoctonia solani]|uniref:Transposase family Tnp2 protein n=1 Tax=Rhizoctonia solani TaxID=456999 RepID=A0A8H8P8P8_9AGAM|nr:Transposase family Tnp2 protein [Rhizoctonia solani]QRW26362.1 Transposase family Tnp2 protein [Rhizoctonia solani]
MTGAPDSQTKSNDNDIAHQLAGQEFRMEEYPQINDTIGYNTYDPEGDTLDDDDRSDYSRGSWYRVATPLPSPPSPPPEHESGLSEPDDDGFQNVDAEDYREYERCTDDEEVDSIIMLAIRQFGSVTQNDYERIRYSYRHKLQLMSTQRLRTRIAALSGVEPENVDCCLKYVMHSLDSTPKRMSVRNATNPVTTTRVDLERPFSTSCHPTLRAYFNNPDFIRKMLYRFNFVRQPGEMNDFFNSSRYDKLLHTNIVIDGDDTGVPHFPGKHDIALAIMTDGVQIFDQVLPRLTRAGRSWPRTLTCRRRNELRCGILFR